MRITITQEQLNQIRNKLGRDLQAYNHITYFTFRTYDRELPEILGVDLYWDIVGYFLRCTFDNAIYFDVKN